MTDTKIQPALTPDEWRIAKLWHVGKMIGGRVRGMVVLSLPEEHQHGAAALALYGQPFGFTREEWEAVAEVSVTNIMPRTMEDIERSMRLLSSAAAKIAALLPPETS